jgi:hypothetical protein
VECKTQEQEQIIALTAELGKIKDDNLRLARSIKSKANGTSKQDKKKGAGKGSNKGKSKNNSKKTCSGEWEWKNHVPSGNDPKHKKFKGKDYYWCLMHKAWMSHHPDECCERERLEAQGGEQSNDNSNDNQSQRASYANALNAIITDIDNSQE